MGSFRGWLIFRQVGETTFITVEFIDKYNSMKNLDDRNRGWNLLQLITFQVGQQRHIRTHLSGIPYS